MAKNVTNEAVLVALRGHGAAINGPISMTGAQNSEWKEKVYRALEPYLRGIDPRYPRDVFEQLFSKAIDTAKKIKDIPTNASPEERLSQTLGAYGVSGQQLHEIMDEAIRIRKATPGIYQAGVAFGVNEYAQAAVNVLGQTGAVLDSLSNAGIKTPPPPAPGTPGAKVTPPPPAPGAPAPAPAPPAPGGPPPAAGFPGTTVPPPAAKPTDTGASKPRGGTPPGGGTPPPALGRATPDYSKMDDAELERELRRTYGSNIWMLNIPEIKEVVFREMRNPSGVTQEIITSAIQGTGWWQKNGQGVADFLQKQATNPTGLAENVEGRARQIERYAIGYGITLSPERLQELATDAEKWQWDVDDINAALAGEFDTQEGESTAFIEGLKTEARQYLVPLSEGTIDSWGKRIIMHGEAEKGNWNQFLRDQAAAMFPGLAERLKTGTETVMDIAKPYASLAAQYLEIDEGEIDFMKPQWMRALDVVDDKGVHTSMSPADWVRTIKTDSVYRYDYTEQAKKQATGMATDLLKKFGVM